MIPGGTVLKANEQEEGEGAAGRERERGWERADGEGMGERREERGARREGREDGREKTDRCKST